MKGLREKFRKNEGFTLVEMLIVVAIIAILIAVSIPLVNGALEKARDATDQANERAAKAKAALVYLGVTDETTTTGTFWYDATEGKLVPGDTKPTGNAEIKAYGKCDATHDAGMFMDATDTGKHTTEIIKVEITTDGEITISWA